MNKNIETLILQVAEELKKRNWSLVTAESCTGGALAAYISQIPNCSSILERGYITYSEEAKQELLGVKAATIKEQGAVSLATAKEMAEGALHNSHAQSSIAITGLAGPTGDDTSNKAVGDVCIGYAAIDLPTIAMMVNFSGDRKAVCEKAIEAALLNFNDFIKASSKKN